MLLIETGLWSLIVISGILYLWLLIRFTIMTNYNISLRLMFQAVTVAILCFAIEKSIPSIAPVGKHWALEYVMPFVMVATTLAITMLILIRPLKYKEYSFYLFCMTILGFLPLVLYFFGWMDPAGFLPGIISAGYSVITILGMFMFADRTTKDELVKRFHI
jgi:phosphoglycerol transferase MdoB-like AlkP superfamily enzyme